MVPPFWEPRTLAINSPDLITYCILANELVVSSSDEGLQIAVLENGKLVELQQEKGSNEFAVGDVFLGRVRRLLPGLNAAFVDIGYPKDGFLHYLDLGPQVRTQNKYLQEMLQSRGDVADVEAIKPVPDINKHGKITEVLKSNQIILVQIMKEAISSKGPRLSSQLSIAGQYIILMPFSSDVAISRKIKSSGEKRALKKFLLGRLPKNFGIIVRTAAEGVDFKLIEEELNRLKAKFDNMTRAMIGSRPPKKVLSEMDRTSSLMRDMLSMGFDAITTDDKEVYTEIKDYLDKNLPEKSHVLSLKQPRNGLFQRYGIEKQIKGAFGKTVNLSNGAYVVIEHTEALHSIDINSGSLKVNNESPEDNALRINLDAATEIARQLRLRDMGGIIVVDFIDQRRNENRKLVHKRLKDEMSKDRAKHAILPMSRFGLIQITRQRVRPEVNIQTDEVCPNCNGTGKIRASILVPDEVENNVDYLFRKMSLGKLTLQMNPILKSHFTIGFPSRRMKWFMKYKKWVAIHAKEGAPFSRVKYIDSKGEEIKLS